MWERLVVPVLELAVEKASPEIRKALLDFLVSLETRAKATPNPFDDLLVMAVKAILNP